VQHIQPSAPDDKKAVAFVMSREAEVRELVKEAVKQGFQAVDKKNGWMLRSPDGVGQVMVHKTPNSRGIRHYVRDLRKYGFDPGDRW
jgi:hypothetical protein